MVIGFDGSRAFRKDKTGTENYSFQLLKALAKVDKKNTYIVYLRPHSENSEGLRRPEHQNVGGSDNPEFRSSDLSGNPSHSESFRNNWPSNFQFKIINFPRLWTQIGLARQTFKDNLDVLFIPAHTSPLLRKPGLKTVVTVHDLGVEYLPKMHQIKQRLYLKWISNYQLKSAAKLIAVSGATKKDLVERTGVEPLKVEVIYEGFSEKLKQVKGDILVNSLRQYRLFPGRYFLFVGTVQPRKNLERLIKAFSRFLEVGNEKWDIEVRDFEERCGKSHFKYSRHQDINNQEYLTSHFKKFSLVIAGSKGWLSDEIYNLPKRLGIEDKVKFLGYVPDKDMAALYSGAIALVFPSLFEGFGLPILEAQACGCPVITSNVSSMPEVAGKGAVYVDPYNVETIAHAMIRVRESKSQRVTMIKAGFENIKRFSWEKCAAQTLKVFEEIRSTKH